MARLDLQDALVLLETAMEQIGKFFKENKHLGRKKKRSPGVEILEWLRNLDGWIMLDQL